MKDKINVQGYKKFVYKIESEHCNVVFYRTNVYDKKNRLHNHKNKAKLPIHL